MTEPPSTSVTDAADQPDKTEPATAAPAWRRSSFSDSHGVTTSAIISDSSIPTEALIGMGRMYGPIRPVTKAIGSKAAMTVSVARMVGPPTSSTAPGMISSKPLSG